MLSDRCATLYVEYRIKVPAESRRAIAISHENIADGTLEEIPSASSAALGEAPFSNIKSGGP